MSRKRFLGEYTLIISILHGGDFPNLLQYCIGGGSTGTPNLYYVINGRPLMVMPILMICSGDGIGVYGVDGGEYDHVDGDSDQTFHMISVSSNVTPLQVTCSNSWVRCR